MMKGMIIMQCPLTVSDVIEIVSIITGSLLSIISLWIAVKSLKQSQKSIELAELLEGTDLERAMNATREMGISPAIFVNIILYNAQYEQRINIDWENMIIYPVLQDLKMVYSQITIYVDLEYMNNQIKLIDNAEKSRLQ